MLPTLNRAVKMPEADRIRRNKTAWPQGLHRSVFGVNGGYHRHLHHRTLLYVSSKCQYLPYGTPNNCCGIGSMLDVGPLVELLNCPAGTIRKQT
jgi:hypothetical protein